MLPAIVRLTADMLEFSSCCTQQVPQTAAAHLAYVAHGVLMPTPNASRTAALSSGMLPCHSACYVLPLTWHT